MWESLNSDVFSSTLTQTQALNLGTNKLHSQSTPFAQILDSLPHMMYKIKIICLIFSTSTQGLYSIHGTHLGTQTGSTVHLHTHVWFKSTHPAHLSNVDWGATGGHENSQPSLHCESTMSLQGQPAECE